MLCNMQHRSAAHEIKGSKIFLSGRVPCSPQQLGETWHPASIVELPECHWQPQAWCIESLANGMTRKQQPTKISRLGKGCPLSHHQSFWCAARYASGAYEISFHYTTNLQGMKL